MIQDIERHVFYVLFPVVNGNDLFLRYAVLLRQAQRYRIEACCALSFTCLHSAMKYRHSFISKLIEWSKAIPGIVK
ncbi:hypothetical protein HMPREF9406_1342 [Clostridium sp. HGF2]|nr:hypothetical protein HMPREF9406_1342 [Clostridium sp. HGF2]